jgi:hypothetical protein
MIQPGNKMKKILILGVFFLLAALPAAAQFTTTSATVVDPNGIPYAQASIQANLIPPAGGGNYNVAIANAATADNAGHFTMNLADNLILVPGGSQWAFVICENPGAVIPLGHGSVCFNTKITIHGATQDISATLNALAPALGFAGGGGGGTVTTFTAGNLSPLFSTSVSNPTTTPALSFTITNAPANSVLGNNTGGSAAPGYQTSISISGGLTAANVTDGALTPGNCVQAGALGILTTTGSACGGGGGGSPGGASGNLQWNNAGSFDGVPNSTGNTPAGGFTLDDGAGDTIAADPAGTITLTGSAGNTLLLSLAHGESVGGTDVSGASWGANTSQFGLFDGAGNFSQLGAPNYASLTLHAAGGTTIVCDGTVPSCSWDNGAGALTDVFASEIEMTDGSTYANVGAGEIQVGTGTFGSPVNPILSIFPDSVTLVDATGHQSIHTSGAVIGLGQSGGASIVGITWNANAGGTAALNINPAATIGTHTMYFPLANGAAGNVLTTDGGNPQQTTWSGEPMAPFSTVVGSLPSAAANSGKIAVVTDSTTVAVEGQTCSGGSGTVAMAFSNGSVWKCF